MNHGMNHVTALATRRIARTVLPLAVAVGLASAAGCSPTVKVEAPDKPIEINLNVKIQQEVRIKVERDVENLLDSRKSLF